MRLKSYNHQGICEEQYHINQENKSTNTNQWNKKVITTKIKSNNSSILYFIFNQKNGDSDNIITLLKKYIRTIAIKCKTLFYDLFLPIGYPLTVKDVYLEYQMYDSLQGLCSYLRGIVSTSAVLQAAGVGNANATVLSAAITWILKDGIGLIGGLFYSYSCSPYFDSHVKEFRLCADIFNDIGLTIDMLAPTFDSSYFILLSSISTLFKVSCGIAANATKSSITIFLATNGNIADLNAKESTQETAVSLLGMIGGLLLAKFLHENNNEENDHTTTNNSIITIYAWVYFITLTIIHIWANYKGVQLLRLNTLNRERFNNILYPVTNSILHQIINKKSNDNDISIPSIITSNLLQHQLIKSPNDVYESLLSSMFNLIGYNSSKDLPNVFLGTARLSTIIQLSSSTINKNSQYTNNNELLTWIFEEEFINEEYFIFINDGNNYDQQQQDNHNKKHNYNNKLSIYVCLRYDNTTSFSGSNSQQYYECKAYVHAYIIQQFYYQYNNNNIKNNYYNVKDIIKMAHQIVNILFNDTTRLQTTNTTTADASDPSNTTPLLEEKDSEIGDNSDSNEQISLVDVLQSLGWDCTRFYLNYGPYKVSWDNDGDDLTLDMNDDSDHAYGKKIE